MSIFIIKILAILISIAFFTLAERKVMAAINTYIKLTKARTRTISNSIENPFIENPKRNRINYSRTTYKFIYLKLLGSYFTVKWIAGTYLAGICFIKTLITNFLIFKFSNIHDRLKNNSFVRFLFLYFSIFFHLVGFWTFYTIFFIKNERPFLGTQVPLEVIDQYFYVFCGSTLIWLAAIIWNDYFVSLCWKLYVVLFIFLFLSSENTLSNLESFSMFVFNWYCLLILVFAVALLIFCFLKNLVIITYYPVISGALQIFFILMTSSCRHFSLIPGLKLDLVKNHAELWFSTFIIILSCINIILFATLLFCELVKQTILIYRIPTETLEGLIFHYISIPLIETFLLCYLRFLGGIGIAIISLHCYYWNANVDFHILYLEYMFNISSFAPFDTEHIDETVRELKTLENRSFTNPYLPMELCCFWTQICLKNENLPLLDLQYKYGISLTDGLNAFSTESKLTPKGFFNYNAENSVLTKASGAFFDRIFHLSHDYLVTKNGIDRKYDTFEIRNQILNLFLLEKDVNIKAPSFAGNPGEIEKILKTNYTGSSPASDSNLTNFSEKYVKFWTDYPKAGVKDTSEFADIRKEALRGAYEMHIKISNLNYRKLKTTYPLFGIFETTFNNNSTASCLPIELYRKTLLFQLFSMFDSLIPDPKNNLTVLSEYGGPIFKNKVLPFNLDQQYLLAQIPLDDFRDSARSKNEVLIRKAIFGCHLLDQHIKLELYKKLFENFDHKMLSLNKMHTIIHDITTPPEVKKTLLFHYHTVLQDQLKTAQTKVIEVQQNANFSNENLIEKSNTKENVLLETISKQTNALQAEKTKNTLLKTNLLDATNALNIERNKNINLQNVSFVLANHLLSEQERNKAISLLLNEARALYMAERNVSEFLMKFLMRHWSKSSSITPQNIGMNPKPAIALYSGKPSIIEVQLHPQSHRGFSNGTFYKNLAYPVLCPTGWAGTKIWNYWHTKK